MVRDEIADELLHGRTIDILIRPGHLAAGAYVGLFVGDEFGVGENGAVLEIVDAERDRFRPGDRA